MAYLTCRGASRRSWSLTRCRRRRCGSMGRGSPGPRC